MSTNYLPMTSEQVPGAGARIPAASYRLQLQAGLGFRRAAELADYLARLGASDVYASPFLAARPGSRHGYDVVDPSRLNPEIGTEEDLAALAAALRERGMGLVADVVPNHMCISDSSNAGWLDVLENGPSSPFARFFDVDWAPPKPDLVDKVLLPVLGDQYGRVLEAGEIRVAFDRGALWAEYFSHRFPLGPKTWSHVLEPALATLRAALGEAHSAVLELESVLTALRHLPSRSETLPERVRERMREKEIVKSRLAALASGEAAFREAVEAALRGINGSPGDARSFDRLETLLADQAFRLSHWRVATDEINYRRFFDVNDLAAIRVEEPEVFARVHERIADYARRGWITGLRVDHVDGLFEPGRYLADLQMAASGLPLAPDRPVPCCSREDAARRPGFVVVEKILGRGEELPRSWPAHGTTGYDFLNMANGLFVDPAARDEFARRYRELTGASDTFEDVVYESKKLILQASMSSELTVLARRLDRLSEQHRGFRDFTLNSLQHALGEVVACFPVYRTYVRPADRAVSPQDRAHARAAVHDAKLRNPAVNESVFDFIAGLLLLEAPDGLGEPELEARRDWLLRFQQITGPVMAKGVEDTAFYRHVPLASLNEVGGDPGRFGVEPAEFHAWNRARLRSWPHSLSATATHDTKRGEDARLRLDALSEIPGEWFAAVGRWREANRGHRTRVEDRDAPGPNEECLLYQTLLATWPGVGADAAYEERIREYLVKALREAKVRTSWLSPNRAYEGAVEGFLRRALDRERPNPFLEDFLPLAERVRRAGMLSSLSQVVLKIASPGVPDFYQGTELWDLSLVDPDNRRPVDFEARRRALEGLEQASLEALRETAGDGRIKMLATARGLALRRRRPETFAHGDYFPLEAEGGESRRVVAFARGTGGEAVVAAAGRFFMGLGDAGRWPLGRPAWQETRLVLPPDLADARFGEVLSGRELRASGGRLDAAELFAELPAALLEVV